MARQSSSILTKTQRRRIHDGFAELTDEKKYRDQQRIRERIRSGVFDFQLLRTYPDRQFDLAFDDVDHEELEAALADTYVVTERIRTLAGIERAAVLRTARERVESVEDADDLASLDAIDLTTRAEVESRVHESIAEDLQPSRWEARARVLLQLAAAAFAPVLVLGLLNEYVPGDVFADFGLVAIVLALVGVACLVSGVLIVVVRGVKNDFVPSVMRLVRAPRETIRAAWDDL